MLHWRAFILNRISSVHLHRSFKKTLEFVNYLAQLDTDGVPTQEGGVIATFQRLDEPAVPLPKDSVLQNAPMSDGTGFLIPKVL